tara:strand:+ start:2753 stop:3226 length:474 start_codon:yes stop_codon:yes gene_type:complete
MDIGSFSYVLHDHRGEDDAPVWRYSLPTVGDIRDARTRARRSYIEEQKETGGEIDPAGLDGEAISTALVASTLYRVDNLTHRGAPMQMPADADIDARIAFVRRLPYAWLAELAGAVQGEADVDDEDERGEAAPGGRNGRGEVADDVPVPDVPGAHAT